MRRQRVVFQVFWQTGAIVLLAVTLGVLTNLFRQNRLPLVVDRSQEAQLAEELRQSMVISIKEARERFFTKNVVFLDARSPELYRASHIQGALNLHWEAFDEYADAVLADIPKNTLIITYCDGKRCSSSQDLARELFFRGYENVRVLANGWSLWVEHHLPIDKGTLTSSFER
ncbi:MAG: rhodanese-like domain-containing protein [Thermodesulfobacteriota bacterium]|nr:rhodanese-like domain-containing protein [Thermodesulfobacteriota bacterium]